jgi:hypothetical protein
MRSPGFGTSRGREYLNLTTRGALTFPARSRQVPETEARALFAPA